MAGHYLNSTMEAHVERQPIQ